MAKRKKGKPPGQPHWRNRIVSSGTMPAGQFLAHPDNWRIHTSEQRAAMRTMLDTVGWIQDVIVSHRTKRTLDGHMRVLDALDISEEEPVPYKEVDVTENEEAMILASFDPLSAMAGRDDAKLNELLSLIPDTLVALPKLLHEDRRPRKQVQFEAAEHHRVVVDCIDAKQAELLLARLTDEGYTCRTGK